MGVVTYTTGNSTDNLVSFKSAAKVPITSAKFHFKPKQDLHGYSKPWVGGAGDNIWGGVAIKNAIVSAWPNAVVDETAGTVTLATGIGSSNILTIGITFDTDTQYTLILTCKNSWGNATNLIAKYTDDASMNIQGLSEANAKETLVFVSANNKTLASINNNSQAGTTTIYYNESGLFKGIKTASDFAPYENICPISGWTGCSGYLDEVYLPNEYQRIEYLQANGSQWFDTGVAITNEKDIYVAIDFEISSAATGDIEPMGCRKNYSSYGEWKFPNIYGDNVEVRGYGISNNKIAIINRDFKNSMIFNYKDGLQKIYLNDALIKTHNNAWQVSEATTTLYAFSTHNQDSDVAERKIKGKIYSIYIQLDGVVMRKFIPCYRKSDDKPGMYDAVSNTFFINQGTDEFVCGPNVGEVIPITFPVLGKNKFSDDINDYTYKNSSQSQESHIFDNGVFSGAVPANTRDYMVLIGSKVYDAGTYTLSFDYINGNHNYYWAPILMPYTRHSDWYNSCLGSSAQVQLSDDSGHFSRTFTAVESFTINLALNDFGSTETSAINKIYNIQLELGSTATAYEPYDPNTTVYGGYVDPAAGEVVATYASVEFDGADENWQLAESGQLFAVVVNGMVNSYTPPISNRYYMTNPYNTAFNVRIPKKQTGVDTVTEFKALLAEDPLTVIYELATPIHYPLSKTQLHTLLGQNNIWSNTNAGTEVSYAIHDSALIRSAKRRIAINQPHISATSGSIATFNTDIATKVKSCRVNFLPAHTGSGTPSPDNVRTITGWTGCEIVRAGKNLFNTATVTFEKELSGTSGNPVNATNWAVSDYIQVNPSTEYVATNVSSRGAAKYCLYDKNKVFISYGSENTATGATTTITTTVSTAFVRLSVRYADDEYLSTIFEKSPATTYEPYTGTILPIDWTTEAGTVYGGYLDLTTGALVKTWGSVVIDSSNSITSVSQIGNDKVRGWAYCAGLQIYGKNHFSDKMTRSTYSTYNDSPIYSYAGSDTYQSSINYFLPFGGDDGVQAATVEGVKAWFGLNPVTIVSELITPVTYQLTPETLKTLRGTNNIWSNANGNIEVSYWSH